MHGFKNKILTLKKTSGNPSNVIGSGLSAVELCLALRKRWKHRSLQLQTKRKSKNIHPFLKVLKEAEIKLLGEEQLINGPTIRYTGSRPQSGCLNPASNQ